MTLKTDEPTGVNSNGATANERERVGMIHSLKRSRKGSSKQLVVTTGALEKGDAVI